MPEDYFGEGVAERYDESSADMFDPAVVDPVVDFLAELAGDGAALELGIGTGRIALPLAQRGIRVHGIDLSEAMVARLREKPGAETIGVTIGDFATTTVEGTFSVAYLVFNTIMNLTTQDEQVACFQNVAAHLEPGGCFVIEVGVPSLRRLPPGETIDVFSFEARRSRARRVRRREARPRLPSLRGRRWKARSVLDPIPLCVAGGARPDGAPRGNDAARTLERLETRAVHERQHKARLRLGEDGLAPGGSVFALPSMSRCVQAGVPAGAPSPMSRSGAAPSCRAVRTGASHPSMTRRPRGGRTRPCRARSGRRKPA